MAEYVSEPSWRDHVAELRRHILDKVSQGILEDAVVACPVRTGHLKSSLRREVGEASAQIGTDVDYGGYVEMGHRVAYRGRDGQKHFTGTVVPPQPYLRPALYRTREV